MKATKSSVNRLSAVGLSLLLLSGSGWASEAVLKVYKSPSCGCCADWIDHMEENGYTIESKHPFNLAGVKQHYGVSPENSSCHTAVSAEGYIFEGHVPAKYVKRFLENPPEGALGLSVPEMPVGTPGMEMGNRFDPYQIILMNRDGSNQTYADINSPQGQY